MQHRNRLDIRVGGPTLLTAALMLLVLPLQWLAAALTAALWHECCHYIAVKLCGGVIRCVRIGAGEAVMECKPMRPGRELLCSLAGPMGSLLLVPFVHWIPGIAVCGCFHALYNLLPVYPLDGGRALYTAVFSLLPGDRAERLCSGIEGAAVILVITASVVSAFVLKLGIFPMLLTAILLFRVKREKLLANCRNKRYNSPTNVKR